jgi:hypothetical protein
MIVCEDCRKTTSGKCWRHGQITPPTSLCDEILPCLIHRTEAADLPDRAVQPPTDTDTALRTADALWSALYDRLEPEERIGYGRLYEQMYSWMLARAASQERPQPDLWDDIYGEDGTAAQLSAPPEQMSEADRRILETSRSGVAQERPQPVTPPGIDPETGMRYEPGRDPLASQERPHNGHDVGFRDPQCAACQAQERPSIDVERLARELEVEFLLNVDPTGLTPSWWRKRARDILARLSSPVPVEPGE